MKLPRLIISALIIISLTVLPLTETVTAQEQKQPVNSNTLKEACAKAVQEALKGLSTNEGFEKGFLEVTSKYLKCLNEATIQPVLSPVPLPVPPPGTESETIYQILTDRSAKLGVNNDKRVNSLKNVQSRLLSRAKSCTTEPNPSTGKILEDISRALGTGKVTDKTVTGKILEEIKRALGTGTVITDKDLEDIIKRALGTGTVTDKTVIEKTLEDIRRALGTGTVSDVDNKIILDKFNAIPTLLFYKHKVAVTAASNQGQLRGIMFTTLSEYYADQGWRAAVALLCRIKGSEESIVKLETIIARKLSDSKGLSAADRDRLAQLTGELIKAGLELKMAKGGYIELIRGITKDNLFPSAESTVKMNSVTGNLNAAKESIRKVYKSFTRRNRCLITAMVGCAF